MGTRLTSPIACNFKVEKGGAPDFTYYNFPDAFTDAFPSTVNNICPNNRPLHTNIEGKMMLYPYNHSLASLMHYLIQLPMLYLHKYAPRQFDAFLDALPLAAGVPAAVGCCSCGSVALRKPTASAIPTAHTAKPKPLG